MVAIEKGLEHASYLPSLVMAFQKQIVYPFTIFFFFFIELHQSFLMAYVRDDIRTYYKGYSSRFKSFIRVGVCRINQLAHCFLY
jgi:hypothetical protein